MPQLLQYKYCLLGIFANSIVPNSLTNSDSVKFRRLRDSPNTWVFSYAFWRALYEKIGNSAPANFFLIGTVSASAIPMTLALFHLLHYDFVLVGEFLEMKKRKSIRSGVIAINIIRIAEDPSDNSVQRSFVEGKGQMLRLALQIKMKFFLLP